MVSVSTVKKVISWRQVCLFVEQKINGWKIYHLSAGMEDIIDMEVNVEDYNFSCV